jgi:putative heme-binding domain-containing protein
MRRIAALLSVAAVFGQGTDVPAGRGAAQDVAAGAKTFRSHCAECHGLKGEGGRGPNLASGEFFHGSTDADLMRNISDGIPGTDMPGLFYSEDRIRQVVAYLRSLSAGSLSQLRGEPGKGAALYDANGCRECHRIKGNGGHSGPDLSKIGKNRSPQHLRESIRNPGADVHRRYWVLEATGADGARVSGYIMNEDTYTVQIIDFAGRLQSLTKAGLTSYRIDKASRMPSYEGSLNSDDLEHLVAFLSSLRSGGKQ